MKIKCIENKLNISNKYNPSWYIKVGNVYHVLSIEIQINDLHGQKIYYRLLTEEKLLALIPASLFEIVDSTAPASWKLKIEKYGIDIAPESWLRPGFMEDYYNDVPEALKDFRDAISNLEI